MKKISLLILCAGMALGLASCRKDYTCTCTYNAGSGNVTVPVIYDNVKKSDATEACENSEAVFKTADPNATCTLN